MNKIDIYTWTFCPYCIKAKKILKDHNKEYKEIVIDNDKKALENLKKETGSGTVPQVFINNKYFGGCDDLEMSIEKGEFDNIF